MKICSIPIMATKNIAVKTRKPRIVPVPEHIYHTVDFKSLWVSSGTKGNDGMGIKESNSTISATNSSRYSRMKTGKSTARSNIAPHRKQGPAICKNRMANPDSQIDGNAAIRQKAVSKKSIISFPSAVPTFLRTELFNKSHLYVSKGASLGQKLVGLRDRPISFTLQLSSRLPLGTHFHVIRQMVMATVCIKHTGPSAA